LLVCIDFAGWHGFKRRKKELIWLIKKIYFSLTESASKNKFKKAREAKQKRLLIEDDKKRKAKDHYAH
jgi:hypothetical protein